MGVLKNLRGPRLSAALSPCDDGDDHSRCDGNLDNLGRLLSRATDLVSVRDASIRFLRASSYFLGNGIANRPAGPLVLAESEVLLDGAQTLD